MRNMQLAAITVISHDVQTTLQSVSEECQTICCNCLFLWFQNGWSWSPRKDSMLVNVTWNYAHSSGAWCDFIRFSRNSFWQAMATFPLLNTQCYSYEGNNNCCCFFFSSVFRSYKISLLNTLWLQTVIFVLSGFSLRPWTVAMFFFMFPLIRKFQCIESYLTLYLWD